MSRPAWGPGASKLSQAACPSLFTEPSESLPEESKSEEMAFHHCHRDLGPPPGLTSERLQARRQLYAACAVCFVFMAGEVVGKSALPSWCLHQPLRRSWVDAAGLGLMQ